MAHIKLVQLLFQVQDSSQLTALHAETPQEERSAFINTALVYFARVGAAAIASECLRLGADVNCTVHLWPGSPLRPLAAAVLAAHTALITVLVQHGADPFVCIHLGDDPDTLLWSEQLSLSATSHLPEDSATTDLATTPPSDLKADNSMFVPILAYAAARTRVFPPSLIASTLFCQGHSPTLPPSPLPTPLSPTTPAAVADVAALPVVRALLQAVQDSPAHAQAILTVVHWAAGANDGAFLRALGRVEARRWGKDAQGRTPLHVAAEAGAARAVRALVGADMTPSERDEAADESSPEESDGSDEDGVCEHDEGMQSEEAAET